MTWVRHRPIALSWALLLAFLAVLGVTVHRYTAGGVAVGEDLLGLVLRLVVLGVVVAAYLRTGGSTTASSDGLSVHDGIRRVEVPTAQVSKVVEEPSRNGAVAVLQGGRRLALPGVPAEAVHDVRRRLRGR
ncbi:hypothetical protein ACQE98_12945 [Ornithinimicrobium sp. W1679]|uniref:hypothetical protein n=1 Tax=unclassified Ornithinimicrobium TaxID=2615080 RepID=UPI003CF72F1A